MLTSNAFTKGRKENSKVDKPLMPGKVFGLNFILHSAIQF